MPLSVRRFCTSFLLVLIGFIAIINAQPPTSGDVMRDRVSKAKAYIAVRNYNAAIYELENIRRETSDATVNAVTNVLLMNSYLEQGDYKRAQDFLGEFYKSYKSNNANANLFYSVVAGQVVRGARDRVERYRALGLNVADRNLPLEAVNDLERMRETLEIVITQAKEFGKDKAKSASAMALLEEATNSRSLIARDDYDAHRWKDEVADAREQMASSRSVITNAVDGTQVQDPAQQSQTVAANIPAAANTPAYTAPVFKPVANDTNPKPSDTLLAANNKPVVDASKKAESKPVEDPLRSTIIAGRKPENKEINQEAQMAQPDAANVMGPLEVGSLITYATKQTAPVYPPAARNMRASGIVRVEVTVNEAGDVAEVQKTSGPALLQTAAKDAVRKWKFKPFVRDGQPVKANGFISFNFAL